ncbi:hypothetical protein LPJ66_002534 [Kickxella alabastrina]|uniref:Uncharacterized protein n=1 Tax=Kickxella alabastrina TaxID=61397 RepID=A0ACC1IQ86_9FUNG|nr:hypothetical protein LPJ66_002534 [Kickxella alabastrina]
MAAYKDIVYVKDSADLCHTLDIYLPTTTPPPRSLLPLILYIHGGAWRTDDKQTIPSLGPSLAHHSSAIVAIPNYRLSTRAESSIRHPTHLEDVQSALHFLQSCQQPYPGHKYVDHKRIYLVGHSAGAHLATMAVLTGNAQSARGVLGIGGIYDIPGLLKTYPSYKDFVEMAFWPHQYQEASPLHRVGDEGRDTAFMLVNSVEDELVGSQQAVGFAQRLIGRGYRNVTLAVRDIGGHYEQLERPEFWNLVADFVASSKK